MDNLANFMKRELIKYMHEELKKGNSLSNIKEVLLKAGHHHTIIEEAISGLRRHNFDVIKALAEPVRDDLKRELYYDVINSLVKYIEYQIEDGKPLHEIEQILLNYGHPQDTVIAAIHEVTDKRAKQPAKSMTISMVLSVATFALLILVLGISTQAAFLKVLLGFMPTLFTLAVTILLINKVHMKEFFWVVPFVGAILFVYISIAGSFSILATMDTRNLALVNLLISLFYVFFMITSAKQND